jgi:hypothetical protein
MRAQIVGLIVLFAAAGAAAQPIAESKVSTIGFRNTAEALAALHKSPGVEFSVVDEWTVANERATGVVWSFPPPGHPAYPAAVRRQVVEENGVVSLKMDVVCEATKAACDELVRSFQALNAKVEAEMQKKAAEAKGGH